MFGKKNDTGAVHLAKPVEMPEAVGRYLVVQMKKDPDWVWNLKAVMRHKPDSGNSPIFDVRVFDPKTAGKGVVVTDWTTLDANPDLVLYEGWFDKKLRTVQMEEKKKA
jgi:hypothetical protein